MRELKFRAWDLYNKRWLKIWMLYTSVGGDIFGIREISGESYGLHQVELRQYTGIMDNNGKEIYEGDILTNDEPGEWEAGDGERATVAWDKDRSRWDMNFFSIYGGEGHMYADEDLAHRVRVNAYVVIGNIYENPELL